MRATRHQPAPTTPVDPTTPLRRDVIVRPAPLAMVWQGVGSRHEAIAVPGVSLAPGDVLVSVELATVCPSDAATVVGGRPASAPLVLGHEQVGRVVAIGDGATTFDGARLIVGMRVVWSRTIPCGECARCHAGESPRCTSMREYGADRLRRGWELGGGFATHVLVRSGTLIVPVPEIVPAAVLAPASCATAFATAAVERISRDVDIDGEVVAVWGAGLVGLTVAAMLADEGARVLIADASARARARGKHFGAVGAGVSIGAALHSLDVDRDESAGSGIERVPVAGVDVGGTWPDDLARVAADGLVVRIADDGESMIGSSTGRSPRVERIERPEPRHLPAAVDFLASAWFRYPFADLVGERFPLERVDAALAAAATEELLRVAVEPGGR